MRINPTLFGVLALALFVGVIEIFQAAGIWSVSGKVSASGEAVQPLAGDVNTIKGWMTFEQISTTYNVPLEEILAHFDLPSDTPASTAIKDLESDLFSVTALRSWLQSRSQPAQPETPTPAAASVATTPPAAEHVAPTKTVTGKTTFQELLDWGIPQSAIQEIIGGELPAASVAVKDYVTQNGLEFASIKAALQMEVDKTE